jgi:hypothetical protein
MEQDHPGVSARRLVLFDALSEGGGTWRGLAAYFDRAELRGRPVGLVGLAQGAANIVLLPRLDVTIGTEQDPALVRRIESHVTSSARPGAGREGRVLVMSGDVAWRRRVCLLLEGHGIRALDVSGVEAARSLAQRWHVRGLVVDLLLPSPGIASVLAAVDNEVALSGIPTLVVGRPDALSPRQILALRQDAVRWSSARQQSVTQLADAVEHALDGDAGPIDELMVAGGCGWRGR